MISKFQTLRKHLFSVFQMGMHAHTIYIQILLVFIKRSQNVELNFFIAVAWFSCYVFSPFPLLSVHSPPFAYLLLKPKAHGSVRKTAKLRGDIFQQTNCFVQHALCPYQSDTRDKLPTRSAVQHTNNWEGFKWKYLFWMLFRSLFFLEAYMHYK